MKNIYFLLFATTILVFNHSWLPGMFMDGGIYATLGKNAALFNYWLVPHFSPTDMNQFFEHPPTLFIFEGLLFKLFGVSWSVARLTGLIFNLGTIWILWSILSKLRSRTFAYCVAMILLLCLPYLKKSRFPNMDIAMTFFITGAMLCYFKAFILDKPKYWLGTGVFFGLAALMKGHPALFVPMTIFVHLLITKNIKRFASWAPWYSLFIGFGIFLLWPLSLKLFTGSIEIFELWFKRQFIDTVLGDRSGLSRSAFTYVIVLLKGCLPWLLLAGWGVKTKIREPLFLLGLVWFSTILVSLSCVGWKLDHYILSLYPALAIMAAYGIEGIGEKALDRFAIGSQYLVLIIATVLLCVPGSNEIRRTRSVFYAKEIMKTFKTQPSAFALVGNSMGYWTFAPAVSFPENLSPYRFGKEKLQQFEKEGRLFGERSWMFLVDKQIVKEIEPLKKLEKVIEYKNSFLLTEKRLLNKPMIYPYKKY